MIEIRKVQTIDGRRIDLFIASGESRTIDAKDLTLFPALIDPHVHFRVPGLEHKETWETAVRASIAGGVTTVFDMPNTVPSCCTKERLKEKQMLIDRQIGAIPFRYHLFFGADANHLGEVAGVKEEIIGLKIYMGHSTGDLLMHEKSALEKAFKIAGEEDILVAVHAEDEAIMAANGKVYKSDDPAVHSKIRSPEAAAAAVELSIALAKKYKARLYLVHVSTEEELKLIRTAKKAHLPVYAEATPHHLFLNDDAYSYLGTKGLVNPPLRSATDTEALWEAIHDGTIDTIGTDHAPHLLEEKLAPYGKAPSGFASIELYLPLLLNAAHEQKISLAEIVSLTHTRPQEIFRLPHHEDIVLVDLQESRQVKDSALKTKAGWSPYNGWTLKGWPKFTISQGKLFDLEAL